MVLVKAISRPPITIAVTMARIVTTTELPSMMASRIARPNGGRCGAVSAAGAGEDGVAGAGADSLILVS